MHHGFKREFPLLEFWAETLVGDTVAVGDRSPPMVWTVSTYLLKSLEVSAIVI